MSAKQRLKLAMLWTIRAAGGFAFARWLTRRKSVIIGWHGVSFLGEHEQQPEYCVSPETLRRRLVHLQKHFEIVPLEDLVEQHAAGAFRPRQVALTFDDAMYDFLAAADPVLREFRAPATVYVISSMLDVASRANMLILQQVLLTTPLRESPAGLAELEQRMPLTTHEERIACLISLRRQRFKLDQTEAACAEYVERLAVAFEVDISEIIERRVWDYMTADEVRQMSEAGYSMQVHSHNHHHTSDILDTLEEDTKICRERVARLTGKPAIDYCYPSGTWCQRAGQILTEAGMRSAVSCTVGHNDPRTPIMALRRYIDSELFTQLEFEFVVSGLKWLLDSMRRPGERYQTAERASFE